MNIDDLVKSPQIDFSVIPMEMGIQSFQYIGRTWFPACAGKTTFGESINTTKAKNIVKGIFQGEKIDGEKKIRGWGLAPKYLSALEGLPSERFPFPRI